ncbi:hypothetical protein HDU93_008967 [Gonapodya sp. JEL0774]|nr:hypothetical protein HDU93_008967 [Gonapodya sp. JEL0774]
MVDVAQRIADGRDGFGNKIAKNPEFVTLLRATVHATIAAVLPPPPDATLPSTSTTPPTDTHRSRLPLPVSTFAPASAAQHDPTKNPVDEIADLRRLNEEQRKTIERMQGEYDLLRAKYESAKRKLAEARVDAANGVSCAAVHTRSRD